MKFKDKMICLLILTLMAISSLSIVSAMEIDGGAFSTNGGLDDLTYASIDVGSQYSGEDVIIQIYYSRDGSLLNHGNMVPKTVTYDGFINIRSADAYKYFPDKAEINIYDTNSYLIDTYTVTLSPERGIQTFGYGDYDHTYICCDSDSGSSSNSGSGGGSSYHSGTSSSYVGNSATGKFHAPGCGDVDKMNPSNKVFFSSRDEAVSCGYDPCGHCRP